MSRGIKFFAEQYGDKGLILLLDARKCYQFTGLSVDPSLPMSTAGLG